MKSPFLRHTLRSARSRGPLRPLRGSTCGLGQPDAFGAGTSPYGSRQPARGGYVPHSLGTRSARLGRFPMGRAHPQGADTFPIPRSPFPFPVPQRAVGAARRPYLRLQSHLSHPSNPSHFSNLSHPSHSSRLWRYPWVRAFRGGRLWYNIGQFHKEQQ